VQFLKEITTQFVTSLGKRRKVSIVKCRPIGHRCCNGINNEVAEFYYWLAVRTDANVDHVWLAGYWGELWPARSSLLVGDATWLGCDQGDVMIGGFGVSHFSDLPM